MQRYLLAALGCAFTAAAHGEPDGASAGAGRAPQPGYQVTMTWVSGSDGYAAIDGELYEVGDSLPDGAKVLAVEAGTVRLSRDGVSRLVGIVDKPPSRLAPVRDDGTPTPLPYLDEAIEELETAAAGDDSDGSQRQRAALAALRDRLIAARDRLADPRLPDAQRARIESELTTDWLRAQQKLDVLRRRLAGAGGGLGIEELRATQGVLEDAALAALRPTLVQLETHESDAPEAGQSVGLLESVTRMLGSYPDYHALAEKLEQLYADQAQ